MQLLFFFLATLYSPEFSHGEGAIMERRIWIERAGPPLYEEQCEDEQKRWRCLFKDRKACQKAIKEAFAPCQESVLPDIPEYIEGDHAKEQANKVVLECITVEMTKKHLLNMPKDRMDEYNVCTGTTQRAKPLSASMQKALDFSKLQTGASCANGSYLRKCFSLAESECRDMLAQNQQDCATKMEAEGPKLKDDDRVISDAGRQITDCALADTKKKAGASRPKSKDKDCL
ncbi:MAG TPA: hypothetical protein VIH99_08520 [Bdellovibrionota bacterium]|jgi:hypothetical protein